MSIKEEYQSRKITKVPMTGVLCEKKTQLVDALIQKAEERERRRQRLDSRSKRSKG